MATSVKLEQGTDVEQDNWARVKGRLRSSVGEDVYTSWFARMDIESVTADCVRISVPTKFLRSWIQAHYSDLVLTCWQAEAPQVKRVDLTVRSAMRCPPPVKDARTQIDERRTERQLIADYEALIETIVAGLTPANHQIAVALAAIPEKIRGFGPVKARHLAAAKAEEAVLREQFRAGATAFLKAAE